MATKAWVLMRFEEGRSAYGPYPETFSVEGVFLDEAKGKDAERKKNEAEGHDVDDPDWDPIDVEDDLVFILEEVDLLG